MRLADHITRSKKGASLARHARDVFRDPVGSGFVAEAFLLTGAAFDQFLGRLLGGLALVVELAADHVLALGLALGLVHRAGDVDLDRGADLGVRVQGSGDAGTDRVQLHAGDAHLARGDGHPFVTVSIGGNDMRWGAIFGQCRTPAFTDRRCRHNRALENEVQWRIELMENRVTPALRAIRNKAPRAQIIVVGLGGFIGFTGCWPLVPLSDPDARWMREVFNRANGALWRASTEVGGTFIDANGPVAW